ncbi:MAG: hypothetical protein ACPGOV_05215 [Magnetovibrionaceae bacterium]
MKPLLNPLPRLSDQQVISLPLTPVREPQAEPQLDPRASVRDLAELRYFFEGFDDTND